MSAQLLDGKALSADIRQSVAVQVKARADKQLPPPGLAVILIGEHPASTVYIKNKAKACEEVGIHSIVERLPETTSQQALLDKVEQYNQDPSIHGILIQLPLPEHIDANFVLDQIDPNKDVDGFHPLNFGLLAQRRPNLRSCTPYGIMLLLAQTGIPLRGQYAVIVGASNIVGRPLALELIHADVTVTICHRYTTDIEAHVRQADILVVAVGLIDVVPAEWIKPGAIVIDVGIHRLTDGSLRGDLNFKAAKENAAWITPVPGGVGPMTIACLLKNTLQAAEYFDQVQAIRHL